MRTALTYTLSRLLLFVAVLLLLDLAGARGLLLIALALLISGLLSYVLLSRQRDAMAGSLFSRLSGRTRWAAHDVRLHRTGVKHFQHPAVGRLDLTFDAMEIPTDRGLTMTCYTAEPGTTSDENLKLLASWGATLISHR